MPISIMDDSPFLIVGGGIAGLSTALGLSNINRHSLVLEKAPKFETVGAGLQLGPNAVLALQKLGAWDAIAPHCFSPDEIHIRDGISGSILQRVKLGESFERRFGSPYRVAHRADLQAGLLESVRAAIDIEIKTSSEVVEVFVEKTSISLKSGENITGSAIIAADGVRSFVRQKIIPNSIPDFTGHTLFRTLIPIGAVPSNIETNIITLWLYPGGHVVHYAVSSGKQFNIVVAIESPNATPAKKFVNACSPLAGILIAQEQWFAWPAYSVTPNPNWSKNNVVLIGDAAHPALPYLAQGAAMSIEDAVVLSKNLAKYENISTALQNFSRERYNRTRKIQTTSHRIGKVYHAGKPFRAVRNRLLSAIPTKHFLKQVSWVYDWQI